MAFHIGTFAGDVYLPSASSDIFFTLFGNDTISTGSGADLVYAGAGQDRIIVGSGDNTVYGGRGDDVFVFTTEADARTVIGDFDIGSDKIDLSDLGITDFETLTIASYTAGSVILIGDLTIELTVAPQALSAQDFIFFDDSSLQILDFEDLSFPSADAGFIPDGYAGLEWSGFTTYETEHHDDTYGYTPHSGQTAAQANGSAAVFAEDNFEVISFYASAGGSNDMVVLVTGYDDGEVIGEQFLEIDYAEDQFIELDTGIFGSVDRVEFDILSHGESVPGTPAGTTYIIDDLMIIA